MAKHTTELNFKDERKEMMQAHAHYLDTMATGNVIIAKFWHAV